MINNNQRRINGLSWPLDKYQMFSWIVLLYLSIMFISTFCAAMTLPWSYLIGTIFSILFLLHLIMNISVMFINPAEEVDAKKIVPINDFDRQKHKHVIENQFCNICQIIV